MRPSDSDYERCTAEYAKEETKISLLLAPMWSAGHGELGCDSSGLRRGFSDDEILCSKRIAWMRCRGIGV
jgi:hypothetical protein